MKLHPLILGLAGAVVLTPGAVGALDRAVSSGHQTKHHGGSAAMCARGPGVRG